MTDFIATLQQLNCLPAFTVAMVCLVAMTSLLIFGIVTMIKEINQC